MARGGVEDQRLKGDRTNLAAPFSALLYWENEQFEDRKQAWAIRSVCAIRVPTTAHFVQDLDRDPFFLFPHRAVLSFPHIAVHGEPLSESIYTKTILVLVSFGLYVDAC